jgi:3-hydroxymyristoyl/3-hydroxydecanoyl-(acyl carrier protein) dehydratase
MNSIRSQMRSMLSVEPRAGGFRAVLNVSPDLSILPDHFAGAPILPAVCLIQAILLAGASAHGHADLRLASMKNAKLVGPIFPGDQITIDAETTVGPDGKIAIRAKVIGGEKRKAEISLVAVPVLSAEAVPA